MKKVIEHCVTLQSVNKAVKTRHDVIKYLSWRELDWRKGIMRSAAKRNSILSTWSEKITEESRRKSQFYIPILASLKSLPTK